MEYSYKVHLLNMCVGAIIAPTQCKEARTRPNLETLKRGTDIKKKGLQLPFVILHTAAELSMGAFVNLHALALRSERRKAWKLRIIL